MKKTKLSVNFSLIISLLANFGVINNAHDTNQEFTLKIIGHNPVEVYTNDVQSMGVITYLTDWFEEVLIYDVSNPANISLLGSYECFNDISFAVKGVKTFLIRGDYTIMGLSSENGKKRNEA
jgi:hypothetical protein